jgi:hypothetical protein
MHGRTHTLDLQSIHNKRPSRNQQSCTMPRRRRVRRNPIVAPRECPGPT